MAIPPEISTVIDRLNQELNATEQAATSGLNIIRPLLSSFPNNYILVQFFAYFNTALFFVVDSRRRLELTVEMISRADVTTEEIQEAGEDVGALLGRVLEVKINSNRLKNRLEKWQ